MYVRVHFAYQVLSLDKMQKETLKFKIGRKAISYEGHRDNRIRDLMDILAKLAVPQDTALAAFRENIESQGEYTDDQVAEMFEKALTALAERKNKKTEKAAPAPPLDAADDDDDDSPRKITLSYLGKKFSYEGVPSGKQRALIQLMCKQGNLTREIAIKTFHDNLPHAQLTDEEIWDLVTKSLASKKKKMNATNPSDNVCSGAGIPSSGQHQTQAREAIDAAMKENEMMNTEHMLQVQQQDREHHALNELPNQHDLPAFAGKDAVVDELTNMSSKERDDLNNFIREVLEQPPMDYEKILQSNQLQAIENGDEVGLALTARTMGKIVVYCQEPNSSVSKVIHASPQINYTEFASIVDAKYNKHMALSFIDGEDIVDIDDDDGLAMFLEHCRCSGGRKIKLICKDPQVNYANAQKGDDRALRATNGALTTTRVHAGPLRASPYSSGELAVTHERTYTGHTLAVYCCSFSPTGNLFVSASRDRSVRLWNTATGSCTVMKGGHNGFVLSCNFSPKGTRVVSSSDDRSIKIWNVSTGAKITTLKGHEDKVYCVQYSPTGEYIVSGSCDHTVRVWNAESFSKIMTLRGHTLAVFSCCFSNTDSGRHVVSGSDDRLIKIWDWETGKEVRTLMGHSSTVWSVCYSHTDQFIVSTSMDHEVRLWRALTGSCMRIFLGHLAPVHQALFSDDDKYVYSCARDWSVMIWRVSDGKNIETITGHESTVYHMDIQNEKLLTASLDDTIRLWDIKTVDTNA